ncbi:ATP-binding protein [Micromonospora sp. NPDC093277]|uniref:ATP-binding protein n=1 Tax=Micromonospora sp. NPDC093277 TaxID=3364291 RepID=UPI0038035157
MTPDRDLAARDALVAELSVLRARVRGDATEAVARAETAAATARAAAAGGTGLDEVADGFGLSTFERAVLLLAAGPELVAATSDELVAVGAGPRLTFGTALALLPDAHWSAITPASPLRRWDLVRLLDPTSPTRSPLIVDERVLHHLAGAGHLDAGLAAVGRPLSPPPLLTPTLTARADAVIAGWRENRPVTVHGPQPANVRAVVAAAADRTGLTAYLVAMADLPSDPVDRERMLRRMERETVLGGCAWILDVNHVRAEEATAVARALAGLDAPVAVLGAATDGAGPPAAGPDGAVPVRVDRLPLDERRLAFASAARRAGAVLDAAEVDEVSGVFDLALDDLEQVAREAAAGTALWAACRAQARMTVDSLATVRTPRATWDDLVLPAQQLDQLRALVASVRHRTLVLDNWGFADRGPRGLGSTALFAGPSGTGKTLAAEVIASELGLDLVHVDLSQVVSKWIGETEKHLARLFDAAEDGGCVLLFDEADTLFGKRSEVRDSHDRYANLEVGYLLQRMEAFRGLAILTTNSRNALDPAFTRRLRTIVTFPYPDADLRASLWRRAFPTATPVPDLDVRALAAVDVPGGGIASIALTAAYLAAEDGAVSAEHVRTAARWELSKSGRRVGG